MEIRSYFEKKNLRIRLYFRKLEFSEEADWIQDLDICRIYNPDGVEVEIDPKSDYVDDIERAIMADIKPRWNRLEWHKEYMDGDI